MSNNNLTTLDSIDASISEMEGDLLALRMKARRFTRDEDRERFTISLDAIRKKIGNLKMLCHRVKESGENPTAITFNPQVAFNDIQKSFFQFIDNYS